MMAHPPGCIEVEGPPVAKGPPFIPYMGLLLDEMKEIQENRESESCAEKAITNG